MDRYRADYGSNNNSNSSSISEEEGEEEEEDASSAEEDDFVVDDDIIDGVKMDSPNEKVSLPAAFSTVNTQRFSTNFKIYVEFLLHTILEKDTQSLYFQQAISMVERRVRGLKDSLITSDAWRPTFKMALDRYPLWHSAVCKGLICEGCRQNRAASFEVVLAAEPEDTDAEPREEPFSLGSECYKRAKVYHKLVHFRSHLHKHVRNEAEAFMSSHDNEDDEQLTCLTEDNIMKDMHSSGFIKLLYQQTQSLFSQARFQYMPSSTRKRRSREQPLFNDDDQESYSEEEV
ncbi:hypothetical protein BDA99DRAFT_259099 [Phascolomyces articulosus]|uniref:DUF4211 domain-containing protein n=1 Tax=Phascolomyces articulosus TaxID=60185 RepID=A0AAD5JN59_9FUNG|nr:hypothetical protein BDA99DRAFT_259099 [Phascolomyces articulosus]